MSKKRVTKVVNNSGGTKTEPNPDRQEDPQPLENDQDQQRDEETENELASVVSELQQTQRRLGNIEQFKQSVADQFGEVHKAFQEVVQENARLNSKVESLSPRRTSIPVEAVEGLTPAMLFQAAMVGAIMTLFSNSNVSNAIRKHAKEGDKSLLSARCREAVVIAEELVNQFTRLGDES